MDLINQLKNEQIAQQTALWTDKNERNWEESNVQRE